VWMGDFGRTPRINQNSGRDHWSRCVNAFNCSRTRDRRRGWPKRVSEIDAAVR